MEATKIVFLLFPHIHLQALAGPAQVFHEAAALGNNNFNVICAAPVRQVISAQGLALLPVDDLQKLSLKKGDMVCLPGFDFARFEAGELDGAIDQAKNWMWA